MTAKVIDFGIAKVHGADLGLAPLAPSDVLVGTPAYMSPEQARGDGEVDARTDVWSFGALLFEAASGSLLLRPERERLVKKIAHEPRARSPRSRPTLPPEFSAVVDRALSRDPDRRFSDMAAFAAALRAASLETPSQDPVADAPAPGAW
ncbi:MAG: protein kinase [Polyangiales bacterium]